MGTLKYLMMMQVLLMFLGCDGSKKNSSSFKMNPSAQVSGETLAEEYTQYAVTTISDDLKLKPEDLTEISSEVVLNKDESDALNEIIQK